MAIFLNKTSRDCFGETAYPLPIKCSYIYFGMDEETHDAIPHQPWPVGGGVEWTASDIVSQAPRKSEDEEGFGGCVSDHCIHGAGIPSNCHVPPVFCCGRTFTLEYSSDLATETLLHRRRSKGRAREGERKKRNHGRPDIVRVCDIATRVGGVSTN